LEQHLCPVFLPILELKYIFPDFQSWIQL